MLFPTTGDPLPHHSMPPGFQNRTLMCLLLGQKIDPEKKKYEKHLEHLVECGQKEAFGGERKRADPGMVSSKSVFVDKCLLFLEGQWLSMVKCQTVMAKET